MAFLETLRSLYVLHNNTVLPSNTCCDLAVNHASRCADSWASTPQTRSPPRLKPCACSGMSPTCTRWRCGTMQSSGMAHSSRSSSPATGLRTERRSSSICARSLSSHRTLSSDSSMLLRMSATQCPSRSCAAHRRCQFPLRYDSLTNIGIAYSMAFY